MARKNDKDKAIELRKKGYSYSQIKDTLGISKSTLSGWLYDMPLSEKRIKELQADSPIRIERYRNTMRAKRELRMKEAYGIMSEKIGTLSQRDLFIAGLALYWAEGTKTNNGVLEFTNTNPGMIQFFINWIQLLGVEKAKLKIHLHLYSDMDVSKQIKFWSKTLGVTGAQFLKPYIKKNLKSSITYTSGFGQGTCSVVLGNTELRNQILMGIKYMQEIYT